MTAFTTFVTQAWPSRTSSAVLGDAWYGNTHVTEAACRRGRLEEVRVRPDVGELVILLHGTEPRDRTCEETVWGRDPSDTDADAGLLTHVVAPRHSGLVEEVGDVRPGVRGRIAVPRPPSIPRRVEVRGAAHRVRRAGAVRRHAETRYRCAGSVHESAARTSGPGGRTHPHRSSSRDLARVWNPITSGWPAGPVSVRRQSARSVALAVVAQSGRSPTNRPSDRRSRPRRRVHAVRTARVVEGPRVVGRTQRPSAGSGGTRPAPSACRGMPSAPGYVPK